MSWIIGTIVLVLIILLKTNRAKIKGIIGERIIAQQLEKVVLEGYKVLNDILIKTEDGTTQIDHIVISPYGLLVIETKNYKGWIFGREESDYWTQIIFKGKYKFRNPIKQNWGHICVLKKVLPEYKEVPFYSIIVMVGSAKIRTMNDIRTKIVYPDMLYETILNHRGVQQLKEEDVEKIYDLLKSISIVDKKVRKEHISQVKRVIDRKMKNIIDKKCPYCGSELLKRKGQYSDFWGCSRYPECRYTIKDKNK